MREILFRGKDSITKSWVYGALVQQQDDPLKEKAFIISYSNYQFGDFSEAVMHEVDPETVGQCTGFGDKNGNKIFEGDIVCMDDWIPPFVDGRLQIRSYEAKDGSKRWVSEIIANGVEFVERKSDKGGTSGDKSEFEQFGHAVPFDEDIPF